LKAREFVDIREVLPPEMRAGFSEIDITPLHFPCQKVGWLKVVIAEKVHDPVYARAAVFES